MPTPDPSAAPPAAITVHRTDTGQFVLTHPSGATALGDSLDGAWAALELTLASIEAAPGAEPVDPRPAGRPRWLWPLLIALPFVWLGALWLALGSIRAEVRGLSADGDAARIEARIGALEAEVSRLGAALDAVRRAPPVPAQPAPAPVPAPQPVAPAPAQPTPAPAPAQVSPPAARPAPTRPRRAPRPSPSSKTPPPVDF